MNLVEKFMFVLLFIVGMFIGASVQLIVDNPKTCLLTQEAQSFREAGNITDFVNPASGCLETWNMTSVQKLCEVCPEKDKVTG